MQEVWDGAMQISSQYVSWISSVCGYRDLAARHMLELCVSTDDEFLRADLWWLEGAAKDVLPIEQDGRAPWIIVNECSRG
jgi:hypothetical protein